LRFCDSSFATSPSLSQKESGDMRKPDTSLCGSIKDDESIATANENGIAMAFTGIHHFKHYLDDVL